jgi:hypothetical protein
MVDRLKLVKLLILESGSKKLELFFTGTYFGALSPGLWFI